jgi:hypothetical protein
MNIVTCIRGVCIMRVLDWMIIALIHPTRNYKYYRTVADLHLTVHRYTQLCPQPSLIVSWQRISTQ